MMNRIIIVNGNKYDFECSYTKNYSGFKHISKLYLNGKYIVKAERQYYNRTWEQYEYQSVMKQIIRLMLSDIEQVYIDKFKLEKGYKRMTDKRKVEFNNYIKDNTDYNNQIEELKTVLYDLETKSI